MESRRRGPGQSAVSFHGEWMSGPLASSLARLLMFSMYYARSCDHLTGA
jgi:hypothetical protein